jgi:hypothetical protein
MILEPGNISRFLMSGPLDTLAHTKPNVVMITTRLAPPWANTSILVEGSAQSALASVPFTMKRRLRAAADAAGFTIDERHYWISGWLSRRPLGV